jgi:hypothetical protein
MTTLKETSEKLILFLVWSPIMYGYFIIGAILLLGSLLAFPVIKHFERKEIEKTKQKSLADW